MTPKPEPKRKRKPTDVFVCFIGYPKPWRWPEPKPLCPECAEWPCLCKPKDVYIIGRSLMTAELRLPGYCPICKANVADVRRLPENSQGQAIYEDSLGHRWTVSFAKGYVILDVVPL